MLLFDLSPGHPVAASLLGRAGFEAAEFTLRQFPDGEIYIQIHSAVASKAVVFCDLSDPNSKVLPALLLADTLRDLGFGEVTLVTPYLPYMRQDIRFKDGEGITSRYFARYLSASFSRLITMDPHLHRYASLDEIYTIPSQVLSATPAIADWIRREVPDGIIIGPDSESDQWVSAVAEAAGCDRLVFSKVRSGDKSVAIDAGDLSRARGKVPIMVDDIISTGRTMVEAARELVAAGLNQPVCIGVHALFSDDARQIMEAAPISRVVSCNTIAHVSNGIDISDDFAVALLQAPT